MNLPAHLFKKTNEAKTIKDLKEAIPDIIEELGLEITNELEYRIERLEAKQPKTRKIGR